LALAALALVFGAYDSYPKKFKTRHHEQNFAIKKTRT